MKSFVVNKIIKTSAYKRGFKKLVKDHRKDVLDKLSEIIKKLINFEITTQYHNHPLTGNEYPKGSKELHVDGDVLLVYRYIDDKLIISLELLNLTNHRDL